MERITAMTPIIRIETEKIQIGNNLFAGFGSNEGGELKAWDANLSSLTIGQHMFEYCNKLETFNGDLNLLTDANYMFVGCRALTSFSSDLSSLTDGGCMFYDCSALQTFTCNTKELKVQDGWGMFALTDSLKTFNYDLPYLKDGGNMFAQSGIESFSSNLSSLTDGYEMFFQCPALTKFDSDIRTLQRGNLMFYLHDAVGAKYLEFASDLSSLRWGGDMFKNRYLDIDSIDRISRTLTATVNPSIIHIGTMTQADYDIRKGYISRMENKGWTVSYDIIASSGTPSTQVN